MSYRRLRRKQRPAVSIGSDLVCVCFGVTRTQIFGASLNGSNQKEERYNGRYEF